MSEIQIGDHVYRLGKLNAFAQFHIARRLAPVLGSLGAAAVSLPSAMDGAVAVGESDTLSVLGPIADAVSKMSDVDVDYVLNTCLSVCARQQGAQWARVQAPGGGLMFQDIDLSALMQLAFAVIRENLGNFFPAAPVLASKSGA